MISSLVVSFVDVQFLGNDYLNLCVAVKLRSFSHIEFDVRIAAKITVKHSQMR